MSRLQARNSILWCVVPLETEVVFDASVGCPDDVQLESDEARAENFFAGTRRRVEVALLRRTRRKPRFGGFGRRHRGGFDDRPLGGGRRRWNTSKCISNFYSCFVSEACDRFLLSEFTILVNVSAKLASSAVCFGRPWALHLPHLPRSEWRTRYSRHRRPLRPPHQGQRRLHAGAPGAGPSSSDAVPASKNTPSSFSVNELAIDRSIPNGEKSKHKKHSKHKKSEDSKEDSKSKDTLAAASSPEVRASQ
ncbi:hypothetical protein L596_028695 [Steinernema carpocapsae]|uniref:Uncharacterized protein n=1 Tax=Steinernema carpocapsae TaxID=34508 RepID=A0A4U5M063_STECR|nr:hypothetical protein L596_028695 [Steinernema carpocapsae]